MPVDAGVGRRREVAGLDGRAGRGRGQRDRDRSGRDVFERGAYDDVGDDAAVLRSERHLAVGGVASADLHFRGSGVGGDRWRDRDDAGSAFSDVRRVGVGSGAEARHRAPGQRNGLPAAGVGEREAAQFAVEHPALALLLRHREAMREDRVFRRVPEVPGGVDAHRRRAGRIIHVVVVPVGVDAGVAGGRRLDVVRPAEKVARLPGVAVADVARGAASAEAVPSVVAERPTFLGSGGRFADERAVARQASRCMPALVHAPERVPSAERSR